MNRSDVNRILSMLLKPHMIGTTTAIVTEHQKKAMADGNAAFVTELGNVLAAIEKYKTATETKD